MEYINVHQLISTSKAISSLMRILRYTVEQAPDLMITHEAERLDTHIQAFKKGHSGSKGDFNDLLLTALVSKDNILNEIVGTFTEAEIEKALAKKRELLKAEEVLSQVDDSYFAEYVLSKIKDVSRYDHLLDFFLKKKPITSYTLEETLPLFKELDLPAFDISVLIKNDIAHFIDDMVDDEVAEFLDSVKLFSKELTKALPLNNVVQFKR